MAWFSKIFGGGVSSVLESGNKILQSVDGLKTSAEEKAVIRKSVIETVLKAQSAAITAEAGSDSWLASSWRPIVMLTLMALVVFHYALFPLIAAMFPATVPIFAAMLLPPDAWILIQVGLGGYITARTGEKLAKTAMPLWTAKQELKKIKLKINACRF